MASVDDLLKEYGQNRTKLHEMLVDLTDFRGKMSHLLPKQIDFRNKFMMEEKMKLVTNIISTELAIRRQIDDSIKNEITIRNKTDDKDDGLTRTHLDQIVRELSKNKTEGE